ncbi:MAG: pilus assembly protein TadG-related protein, partial [Alphaproteobacteria bacterium]|nr:pilus assembly protein TadG-related protein [Alphaproteobacteria bacterium]
MKIFHQLSTQLSVLAKEEKGGVLPLVGLAFTVLVLSSGFAIDYTRAQIVKERLQWAVDAGALAGAKKAPSGNIGNVQQEAIDYFRANFPEGYMDTRGGNISAQWIDTINGQGDGVRFTVSEMVMENYFTDFLGIDDMLISATADVNTLPINPLDLVISIDVSGSMAWRDNTGATCLSGSAVPPVCNTGISRIANAKASMVSLINMLQGPNTRFGIVPWDQKVNAGGILAAVPAGDQMVAPDVVGLGNAGLAGSECASPVSTYCAETITPMTYLTSNVGTVNAAINGLVVDGDTDGALGMMWAVRQFENTHLGGWAGWQLPAENKAIVFITDGFNTRYYDNPPFTDSGDPTIRPASNAQQLVWCDYAKNTLGATIYTIAYNMPNPPSDPRMIAAYNT